VGVTGLPIRQDESALTDRIGLIQCLDEIDAAIRSERASEGPSC
jgi:hypothetical protein